MKRRLWRQWPGRLYSEFNTVGGIIGALGIMLAFVPLLADKPLEHNFWLSVLIGGGGLALALSMVAVVNSWPLAVKPVQEVLGVSISLDILETVDPPPLRVGIVGPSYSGKSTLMRGLAALPQTNERTVGVTATVVMIPTCTHRAIALIDGGGQFYADQFRVAEKAEILIVVLDHNQSETEVRLSQTRLKEHQDFGKQLREHLRRGQRKKFLYILANKSDIWGTLDTHAITQFRGYVKAEFTLGKVPTCSTIAP